MTGISALIRDKTLADHDEDPLLQSAVERQFITVGEALNRLNGVDPEVAAKVPAAAASTPAPLVVGPDPVGARSTGRS